jgi:hypothetical protein
MKLATRFLVLLLAILLIDQSALAAVKAGSSCSKVGLKSISGGKTFTCVKSGKKLVWDKGVLIPVVKPSPSPSESAPAIISRSEPELSFIQILRSKAINGMFPIEKVTYPIPNTLPTSWDDLYEKREGIAYKAWQSISQSDGSAKSLPGTFTLSIGPNTNLVFKEIESAASQVSNKFKSIAQPKTLSVIAFNYEDRDWALGKLRELLVGEPDFYRKNQEQAIVDMCSATNNACWSAMGYTTPNGKGVMLLGIVDKEKMNRLDPSFSNYLRFEKGLTVAHEYFHVMQLNVLGKNWFQMMFAPPSWFNEATAVFVENGVMNQDSYDRYMQFRAVDSKLAYPSCGSSQDGCIQVTEALLTDFFSLSNYANNWNNFPYGMKYEVSNRVIEALVAIKGFDSIMEIYKYQAQDHTFEEAFQHVYGIAYNQAIPLLTKIVTEQFAQNR